MNKYEGKNVKLVTALPHYQRAPGTIIKKPSQKSLVGLVGWFLNVLVNN